MRQQIRKTTAGCGKTHSIYRVVELKCGGQAQRGRHSDLDLIVECLVKGPDAAHGKLKVGVEVGSAGGGVIHAVGRIEDEAEVEAGAPEPPKQFRVRAFGHFDHGGVGQHQASREHAIVHQTIQPL
jgi:hypothetical protein